MDRQTALSLYRTMTRIRKFEEELFRLFSTRAMPGSMHQYDGQEAVAAGVCAQLGPQDYVSSTHRGHGHCIAKGASLDRIMAEMFAKDTGCCRGLGGSMHIADFSVGMLGANGIVAGGIPHAVGAAWSAQYLKNGRVAVAFFGDGAANEGVFHESLNLAAVWRLPVVFVCENNQYGFSTHYRRVTAVEDIATRAVAYAMPGRTADGMDPEAVYEAARQAVARARSGDGPSLLEFKTYRFRGHSRFEPAGYRSKQELEAWKARDPLPFWRGRLAAEWRVPEPELAALEQEADREIAAAVAFAETSPDPDPGSYQRYLFAGE